MSSSGDALAGLQRQVEERTQRCEQLQADLSYCKAQLASAEQRATALSQQDRFEHAWDRLWVLQGCGGLVVLLPETAFCVALGCLVMHMVG